MRFRKIRHTIFALTALEALCSASALAQEQSEIKTESKNLPQNSNQTVEIKAESNKYNPRRDDTVSKMIVTREEIEKYGDASVIDILNRQAGIVNGSINGLKGYTQFLIDGQAPQAGVRISDIPVSQIERIEIIRSALAEYSTQGIAGTINIVLQRTVKTTSRSLEFALRNLSESALSSPMFNLSFSNKSNNFSYDTKLSINVNKNLLEHEEKSDRSDKETKTFESAVVHRENFQNGSAYSATQNFNWLLASDEHLSINARLARVVLLSHMIAKKTLTTPAQIDVQNETTFDHFIPQSANIKVTWNKLLTENTKFDTSLSIYRGWATSNNGATISSPTTLIETHAKENKASNFVTWTGNILFIPAENETSKIGWDLKTSAVDKNILENLSRTGTAHFRSEQAALFAQCEWDASDQWSHYLGARWEGFRSSATALSAPTATRSSGVLSPIFQTRWKATKQAENQVRLAVTRTFQAPSQFQLLPETQSNLGRDISNPEFVANVNLRPEIAWGLDTAFEHFGENEVNYSISHYFKAVSNLMRDRLFFEDNRWKQQTINSGNAIAHGIVAEANFPLAIISKSASKFFFKTNFSRNWSQVSEIPGPNNRFADQAKFNANIDLDYKPNDAWSVAARYGIVSGGALRVAVDRINLEQVGRSTSLSVKWSIDKERSLRISMANLLMQPMVTESRIFSQTSIYQVRTKAHGRLSASAQLNVKF